MSDPDVEDLQLGGFEAAPSEEGLSLDDLSESFARLLGQGESPYQEADEETAPESFEEALQSAGDETDWTASPKGIVEAILFVGHPGSEPISARHMASLMQGVRANEVVASIEELNRDYMELGHPYHIESVDRGYRMILRPEYDQVRQAFSGKVKEAKLSQMAIDVLALIAYRQPLPKRELTEFFGAASGRIAGQLIRRGLLTLDRLPAISEAEGKTVTGYTTTDRFLVLFGLSSLADLPTPQDLDRL